jgi:hypothetical protein
MVIIGIIPGSALTNLIDFKGLLSSLVHQLPIRLAQSSGLVHTRACTERQADHEPSQYRLCGNEAVVPSHGGTSPVLSEPLYRYPRRIAIKIAWCPALVGQVDLVH